MKRFSIFTIERRPIPSGRVIFLVSAFAFLAALIAAGIFFWAYGVSPLHAYRLIFQGALGSTLGLAETVRRAIPLLLIGVGLALAFEALFWNIGAEGQLLLGAVAATWVALFSGLPPYLLIPAMLVLGFLAGAAWALIPAVLKAKMGINDVITTLMMNYIAMYLVLYLIHGPWKGKQMWGFAYTDIFPKEAWMPLIPGTRIHWLTLALGLVSALLVYILITRTKQGFEIRIIGENPEAARFAGISYLKTTLLVMFVSGGLAGLAGVGEVAGVHHLLRHPSQISLGYGYTAIIVAWLAWRNPLMVILTALLFGIIMAGGDVIKVSLGLPFQLVNVFNGLILFFLIGSEIFMRYRIKISLPLRGGERGEWTGEAGSSER
ncbi:MAG: ABC transporter permease [Candidatus Bipolaricaulia bacterium]